MCERCEEIRRLLLQAVAESAARVAAGGAPPDFDGWLVANPDALNDLRLAQVPYDQAATAWITGFVAGCLLREWDMDDQVVPNMPAADA
jgi:hypothetical protein